MTLKQYAIVVAGGSGSRMKSDTPKQFLDIAGLPVLMHTVKAFYAYSSRLTIILVIPEDDFSRWDGLCRKYHFTIPVIKVQGGDSRFQSVKNGLDKIKDDGLVAIHDGVRPLVSQLIISNSFKAAAAFGNAVTAVSLKDSVRIIEGDNSRAMDRILCRLIQTPQTFKVSKIKKAFATAKGTSFTDDASVAEQAGQKIHLIEGSYRNIKITTPEDLLIAEAILSKKFKEGYNH